MFKNYIKIAFRQLRKHKLFSALNIFGLATSMSVCLLLIMIIADQYGYDDFHDNGNRIYRVISASSENQLPTQASFATTSRTVASDLKADYPFVENTVRLLTIGETVHIGEKKFEENVHALLVDQSFLETFSFGWTTGDQRTALLEPRSVVLTEGAAKRFFPYSDPMGATITLSDLGEYTVTGILPDPPIHSHIQFDYLISYASTATFTKEQHEEAQTHEAYNKIWRGMAYVLLDENNDRQKLDAALAEIAATYSLRDEKVQFLFQAQPLSKIMPSEDLSNEIGPGTPTIVLYFLMTLGLIIIFSACFNYTNLSVARSLKRAKEIGVRKVIGARRKDIIFQFLGEAVLIASIALVVALFLLELLIPAFYGLDPFIGENIHLTRTPQLYLSFFGFSLLVGLFAGMLPALNISRLQPIQAIQQLSNLKLFSRMGIQKVLITFQFALSLIFILAVTIILQQQKHVLNTDYGIRIDDILNVRMGEVDYDLFAQKARQVVGVKDISASKLVLLVGENADAKATFKDGRDSMDLSYNAVSPNYLANMDIELVAGKNLPENVNSKGEQFVLLNEMAVKRMGFDTPEAAIGESITLDTINLSIIGVTSDFHQQDIWFSSVQPFALRQNMDQKRNANIHISEANSKATIAAIRSIWDEISPDESMIAFFTSTRVNHLSKFFRMGSSIIGFVGFLTILIACLGLLGMVIYNIEGRVKEVGIRKVLGASAGNIVWQLSKGFFLLLAIAIVLAIPLTVFGANLWLQNFVTRIAITPAILLVGIGIIVLLGLLTVISQTYWAARTNPIESLRNE